MPRPLTASPRPARRRRVVVAGAFVTALLAPLGACAADRADVALPSTAGTVTTPPVAAPPAPTATDRPSAADTAAVTDLLRRRAAALLAGDERGYAGTVADASGRDGRRQLAAFAAARALLVSRLELGTVLLTSDPSDGVTARTGRAEVEMRYRVDDLDTADRTTRLAYDLVHTHGRWSVVREEPAGSGATAPWVAMPDLRVRRGEHAVVAGTAPAELLAEHVDVVDRSLPALRPRWPGSPSRVLVLAPGTASEADALLGRSADASGAVAATTEGPTRPDGTASGDRIVLDPTAFARLTEPGRDVVLTHELAHVAVRATVPGRCATWLAEGYADHVGYARADVPVQLLLAPLLAEVRAGRGPTHLPTAAGLDPATSDIEVPYLAAWQAVELIVERYGEAALRRLVVEGSSTGSAADAEAATDKALHTVLRTNRAELTREWRDRLTDLAG